MATNECYQKKQSYCMHGKLSASLRTKQGASDDDRNKPIKVRRLELIRHAGLFHD